MIEIIGVILKNRLIEGIWPWPILFYWVSKEDGLAILCTFTFSHTYDHHQLQRDRVRELWNFYQCLPISINPRKLQRNSFVRFWCLFAGIFCWNSISRIFYIFSHLGFPLFKVCLLIRRKCRIYQAWEVLCWSYWIWELTACWWKIVVRILSLFWADILAKLD